MCKKLTILLFVLAIAYAPNADAKRISGSMGPNPVPSTIETGVFVDIVVGVDNTSISDTGVAIPAWIRGPQVEFNACTGTGTGCETELVGVFNFVSCTPLDPCVTSCGVDPLNSNKVLFTVAEQCLLLDGDENRNLVSIRKIAANPPNVADCSIFAWAEKGGATNNMVDGTGAAPCTYATTGSLTGCATGNGAGSGPMTYCPSPCINVTKDCRALSQCFPGEIEFGGVVENCGDEILTNLRISDNKGTIDPTAKWDPTLPVCGSVLDVRGRCTYAGRYTPAAPGPSEDIVTASGVGAISGETVTDNDNATCSLLEGTPNVSLVKNCTPAVATNGNITYSIVVTNTSAGDCGVALDCRLEDAANCQIIWDGGLPTNFTLPTPGASRTFNGTVSLPCPDQQIDCLNTASVRCTAPNGTVVTASDNAACSIPPKPINVELNKQCTSAATGDDPIQYTITIRNPNADAPCQEPLTCRIVSETSDCPIEWAPALPALNTPFQVAAGQTLNFAGLYSVPCDHDLITCTNSISIQCTDSSGIRTVSASDNNNICNIPPCREEICRTPGFWGTHAGIEKGSRSQNITQQVISKAVGGALTVCGQTIDDTELGSCDSAVEAICVSVKGEGQRQLVRQLTAAALNCVMSNGNANCSGVSIGDIFADCNQVCQGTPVAGWDSGKCIDAIDCFNNGGDYANGFCSTGTCSNDPTKLCSEDNLDNCGNGASNALLAWIQGITCVPREGNCHDRELCNNDLDLCFEPPGPAGSSDACNKASKNSLYVAEGNCD